MSTTARLGLRLFEATDVANHTLLNNVLLALDEVAVMLDTLHATTGHKHSGVAGDGTKIPYANLTGAPESLPANGGNADTVDSKHAADFALAAHVHALATTLAAGFLSAADKGKLDELVSRVNQALTTTSSPTFDVLTANRVVGAVYA